MGSGGSSLFLMPSRPARSMALNARYGWQVGSGVRNASRFVAGCLLKTGMRMQAERFRWEYTRLIGASYPGTSRRYEFVVGFVNASSELACARSPPMYQRAMSLIPA